MPVPLSDLTMADLWAGIAYLDMLISKSQYGKEQDDFLNKKYHLMNEMNLWIQNLDYKKQR